MKYTLTKCTKFATLLSVASLIATASANDTMRPSPAQESGATANFMDVMSKPLTKTKLKDASVDDKTEKGNGTVKAPIQKVFVRDVVFKGNEMFSSEVLLAQLDGSLGRGLSFEEVKGLALKIQAFYATAEYPIVKVFVPKGALKGTTLTLEVIESRLGKVDVSGDARYPEGMAAQTVYNFVEEGKPIRILDAEKAMVLLNSRSGITAKSSLRAGEEFGSTDMQVELQAENLITGSVEINNFGSESSGEYRVIPYVALQNPLGIGDKLSLFGVIAIDEPDTYSYQASYTAPINTWGTSLNMYYGAGNNAVGEEYEILDIAGESMSWGVGISHMFIFSAKTKLTVEAMFDWQDLDQSMLSISTFEDKTRKIRLGANFETADSMGRTFISLYLHQGLGNVLDAMDNNSDMSSRDYAGADNRFTKFTLGLMRLQSIMPRLYAIFNVQAQYSLDALVATEQIYAGGANSVRGQPYSAFYGDDGVIANAEVRYSVFESALLHFAAFLDYGTTHLKTPIMGYDEWYSAAGGGVGLRSQPFDGFDLRFDVAFPIGERYGDSVYLYGQVRYGF